jgi:hypothetical protein
VALALIQACGGDSGRSTGPTATSSVDLPVVFRRDQIPASCQGVLTATGPGPVQTFPLPPLEVMLSLPAGLWTLTVTITCGSETSSGQAVVQVVPPTPISVNIQVTTSGMLFVAKSGDGTVTGPGINCGGDCSERHTIGSAVTLNAAPAPGSSFAGWSGGGCGGTGSCRVTITTAPITVTATFAGPLGLTVVRAGTGSGTVTSSPGGIACAPTCSAPFAPGTSVTLTAAPAAGSTFAGWSGGGCSGTGPCAVTISGPVTVTATFTAAGPPAPPTPVTLTIVKVGTAAGVGTVTSSPGGINCGPNCVASFAPGTPITLTATAPDTAFFMMWSGGGCPASPSPCMLTLTADTFVTATFENGGNIEVFNQSMPSDMSGVDITGPQNFTDFLVPSFETAVFNNVRPGNYTMLAGQYFPLFINACPAFPFMVTPGATVMVVYTVTFVSPDTVCNVNLGPGGLRRRR